MMNTSHSADFVATPTIQLRPPLPRIAFKSSEKELRQEILDEKDKKENKNKKLIRTKEAEVYE